MKKMMRIGMLKNGSSNAYFGERSRIHAKRLPPLRSARKRWSNFLFFLLIFIIV
jgi:hypothetical protein